MLVVSVVLVASVGSWCVYLQAEAKKKKQVVTDLEREHAMNGKLDDLVEHQRRMDEERDAQVTTYIRTFMFMQHNL